LLAGVASLVPLSSKYAVSIHQNPEKPGDPRSGRSRGDGRERAEAVVLELEASAVVRTACAAAALEKQPLGGYLATAEVLRALSL
jgi:hypothetical protein